MAKDLTFHIRPVLDGQTLAAAVKRLQPGASWADAKNLVAARRVQVNGNLCLDDARRVKTGDVIKIFQHARAPVPTEKDVRVLYIDRDLMVIDKPPGITTLRHAEERDWDDRRRGRQPTLDEVLQKMLPALLPGTGGAPAQRGGRAPGGAASGRAAPLPGTQRGAAPHGRKDHPLARQGAKRHGRHTAPPPPPRGAAHPPAQHFKLPRVRPVHRLDRDTSGLMIFALSPRAESALVEMFKSHNVQRSYTAVVLGRMEEGTIESWLVRDRGDGLRGSTPRGAGDPSAKHAVTHVRPVEHLGDDYTVIECRLETGRTHQIRIHLSESGHMLCGEKVYTRPAPGAAPVHDRSGAPRHALHSASLEFTHPIAGNAMRFTVPLAKDLATWLPRLREQAKETRTNRTSE